MTGTITARLTLEGAPELLAALKELGAAGRKAFGGAPRLTFPSAGVSASFGSLSSSLSSAGSAVIAVGGSIGRAGATFALIGGAAAGLVGALAAMVKSSANSADAMEKNAQKAGLTIDAYGKLQFAAEQNDVSADDFTASMGRLNTKIEAAKGGSAEVIATFSRLGISVSDLATQSPDKVFLDLVDGFSKLKDGAEKSALAIDLFGRGGIALIPLLNQTRAGVLALEKQFDELGLGFTEEQAAVGDALNDSLNLLGRALKGLKDQVGLVFAPALKQASDAATQFIASNKDRIIGFFKDVADTLGAIPAPVKLAVAAIVGLGVGIGAALIGFGLFVQSLGFVLIAVSTITTVVGALIDTLASVLVPAIEAGAAAVGFLLSPIGLTVLAVAATVAALVILAAEVMKNWDDIKQAWSDFRVGFSEKWEAMKASFLAFPAAASETFGEIIGNASVASEQIVGFFASLPDRITAFFTSMASSALSWFAGIIGSASQASEQIVGFFASLPGRVASFFAQIGSSVVSAFGKLFGNASSVASQILSAFQLIPARVVAFFASVVSSIAGSFGGLISRASQAASALRNAFLGVFSDLWSSAQSIFASVMAYLASVIASAVAQAEAAASAAKNAVTGKRDGGLVSVDGFDGAFNFNLGGLVAEVSGGLAPAPLRVARGELAPPRHALDARKMDVVLDGQTFHNFSVPQNVAKAMMKFSRERAGKSARTH